MKQLILTISMLGLFISASYSQFDQEPNVQKEESQIEESVDRAISKIERIVNSIDLEEFFAEDLPEFIEDIKPSPERIEEIEQDLKDGVDRLKDFDASKLEDLVDDIEEGVEEVVEEIEEVVCKKRPQKI